MLLLVLQRVALFLLSAHYAYAQAPPTKFAWDANTEADLKGYRVYTCPVATGQLGCNMTTGVRLVEVLAPIVETLIPIGQEGFAFVTAYDITGNESGASNVIPFDRKPPAPNINFRTVP